MKDKKFDDKYDEVFEALLKIAAKEAAEQDVMDMPSCKELDELFSPSSSLEKRIKNIISSQEKIARNKRAIKKFNKVAAVFFVFVASSSFLLISIEASRNFIINAIINIRSDHTVIDFGEDNNSVHETIFELDYLPNGFELKDSQSTGNLQIKVFENADGEQIVFEAAISTHSTVGIDTENTEHTKISVSGNEAYLFSAFPDVNFSVLTWATDTATLKLTASIDSNELIRIAEGITKK